MIKTFTIQDIVRTDISPEKGGMTWFLLDEQGKERRVQAVTDLDGAGEIAAVQPIFGRETPLVEELTQHAIGDTFTIDFTAFNQAQGYINREVYANMRKCEGMACLAQRAFKMLAVVAVVALLWLGWVFYSSVQHFSQQQPLTRHHELP